MPTRGRNWTVEERKIVFVMVRAKITIVTINKTLKSWQKLHGLSLRELPDSSYAMLTEKYIPAAKDEADLMDMIENPRSLGDL